MPFVACHGVQEDYLTLAADGESLTVPGLYYYIFQQRFGVGAVGTFFSVLPKTVLPLIACFNTTVISMLTSSRSASMSAFMSGRNHGSPFNAPCAALPAQRG